MYWCALGPPARIFRRELGIATLQPVSSPAAGFTTNPRVAVPIPAVAAASVSHSAAVGGSVVGVVGLL